MFERVGRSAINRLLYRLRNSLLPPNVYLGIKELFSEANNLEGSIPPIWGNWLEIIEKFELDSNTDLPFWRGVIVDIRALGFETPTDLAQKSVRAATQCFSALLRSSEERRLWKDCALAFLEHMECALFDLNDAPQEAEKLTDRLRGREFRATSIEKSSRSPHP